MNRKRTESTLMIWLKRTKQCTGYIYIYNFRSMSDRETNG